MRVNSLIYHKSDSPITCSTCSRRFVIKDGVKVYIDSSEPLVDPRMPWRSVTPDVLDGLGQTVTPPTNFLSPSLEQGQQVDRILRNIDEKYSEDAFIEKAISETKPETKPEIKPE